MKIYACGEAQELDNPGSFLDSRPFGRVVGVGDLGENNSQNHFGWSGIKAVINFKGKNYVIDYPESVIITTEDDIEFIRSDAGKKILGIHH